MARGKTTAIERFAALLKASSSIPEVKDFREQSRDVFRLGGAEGLECWIEARRELGLLDNPAVDKAANGLQAAIASAINEALGPLPERPKPRRSWEEQCRLINERETKRRENLPPVGYRCTSKPKATRKPKPKPSIRHRTPPEAPVTPAPAPRRLSMLERMAAAWERLTDKGQAA